MASEFEKIAAFTQGKGYNAATIEQEVKVMTSLLKATPSLAVDIGGNVGNHTAESCKHYPELEIHTFEPAIVNIKQLLRRFSDKKRMHVAPLALSDITGTVALYSNEHGPLLGCLTKRRLDHFDFPFEKDEAIRSVHFE